MKSAGFSCIDNAVSTSGFRPDTAIITPVTMIPASARTPGHASMHKTPSKPLHPLHPFRPLSAPLLHPISPSPLDKTCQAEKAIRDAASIFVQLTERPNSRSRWTSASDGSRFAYASSVGSWFARYIPLPLRTTAFSRGMPI